MARERMVTRTVELTVAEVMTLNVATAEVATVTYKVGGTFKKPSDLLKAIQKVHETDTFKCVAVQSSRTEEVLYGMKEVDFIKLAKVLPPRGSKELAEVE